MKMNMNKVFLLAVASTLWLTFTGSMAAATSGVPTCPPEWALQTTGGTSCNGTTGNMMGISTTEELGEGVYSGDLTGQNLTIATSTSTDVYNVNLPVGSGFVQGTITTNGATGTLFNGDIASFDLKLTDPAGTASLTSGNATAFISGFSTTAEGNELNFNFNGSGSFLTFDPVAIPEPASVWLLVAASVSLIGLRKAIGRLVS